MTIENDVIAALRLEKALIENLYQGPYRGQPWDTMSLDYLQRFIDKLVNRTPDEHTAHAEKMVKVIAAALMYEAADARFKRTDQTKSDYGFVRKGRAQAHTALLEAVREVRGSI